MFLLEDNIILQASDTDPEESVDYKQLSEQYDQHNKFIEECVLLDYYLLSDPFDSSMPPRDKTRTRAINWCFTLNNYTDESLLKHQEAIENDNVTYVIFGREVGETGTPHLQGFVSITTRHSLIQVIQAIGQAHCTVTRSVDDSIVYCKKDGIFEEYGTRPKKSVDPELICTSLNKVSKME
jgi:hypothetical protein